MKCGIHHQMSCLYTSAHNGKAEHKPRYIIENGLALAFHGFVPLTYWVEAFEAGVFTISRLHSSLLRGKSPFELLFNSTLNYSIFHPLGFRFYPCSRATMPKNSRHILYLASFWVIALITKVFVV